MTGYVRAVEKLWFTTVNIQSAPSCSDGAFSKIFLQNWMYGIGVLSKWTRTPVDNRLQPMGHIIFSRQTCWLCCSLQPSCKRTQLQSLLRSYTLSSVSKELKKIHSGGFSQLDLILTYHNRSNKWSQWLSKKKNLLRPMDSNTCDTEKSSTSSGTLSPALSECTSSTR